MMGIHDRAEVCELVGLYIMSKLLSNFSKVDIDLCRDNRLVILRNKNGKETDKIRKNIIKTLKNTRFSIEIATNLKSQDFLDITFNLQTNPYCPSNKPSDGTNHNTKRL